MHFCVCIALMHDGSAGPSLVLYEAIADYEGESDKDQTTLHVGSRVKVLDKKEHGEEGCEGGEGEERRKGGRSDGGSSSGSAL